MFGDNRTLCREGLTIPYSSKNLNRNGVLAQDVLGYILDSRYEFTVSSKTNRLTGDTKAFSEYVALCWGFWVVSTSS